jgi:hypothetical protein
MKSIKLTNDKGNVSANARKELKAFAAQDLVALFTQKFGAENVQITNKGVVVQIGVDFMTEQGIFLAVDPIITLAPVAKESEKKAKAPAVTEPIENPFA